MGKLATKWRGAVSKAKGLSSKEGIGKAGHKIVVLGVHAGLALASKNVDSLGPVPVRPDVAGATAGLLAMLLLKGKGRKLGQSVAEGAAHALITRWVNTGGLTIVNGPPAPEEQHAAE